MKILGRFEVVKDEEGILMEMIEHDFVVRMPPKKKYTIELEVKNIRKGEPSNAGI